MFETDAMSSRNDLIREKVAAAVKEDIRACRKRKRSTVRNAVGWKLWRALSKEEQAQFISTGSEMQIHGRQGRCSRTAKFLRYDQTDAKRSPVLSNPIQFKGWSKSYRKVGKAFVEHANQILDGSKAKDTCSRNFQLKQLCTDVVLKAGIPRRTAVRKLGVPVIKKQL